MNLKNEMTPGQLKLSRKMAGHWIDFAYGKCSWERYAIGRKCITYGPDGEWALKSEEDDEPVRRYERMREMIVIGVYDSFVYAMDDVVTKRFLMDSDVGVESGVYYKRHSLRGYVLNMFTTYGCSLSRL